MSGYIDIVARAMVADAATVDHVAANLANVSTAGYKRATHVVQPFLPTEPTDGHGTDSLDATHHAATAAVRWDLRSGPLQMTGRPLDLSILGDGFFEVITDQGMAYTRLGRLSVDPQGRLVTQEGHVLNGLSGPIRVETATPLIQSNGQVHAGQEEGHAGTPVGTLKVVRFEDPQSLRPVGHGLWRSDDGQGVVVDKPAIRQGALEGSNVDSATEMVRLMQTVRHFESMQKVLQSYDDVLGAAIKKLGEV